MEAKFGRPQHRRIAVAVTKKEYDRIRSSQVNGRNHDVTAYIKKGDSYIVIAKHIYPDGLFRAPSGGLNPGEDVITGINREVAEETGCIIDLTRYLMRTSVYFVHESDTIFWRSFIFEANYLSGDFEFTDKHEIREVSLATLNDFDRFGQTMRASTLGGLHYRAAMHEELKPLL
ncbi:MAG: NUDIX hydrolase, partial [candidate division Zixibacteria bacterium]